MELIKISQNVQDLTGEGTEYLVDSDNFVIAKFYNGNFANAEIPSININETTKEAA